MCMYMKCTRYTQISVYGSGLQLHDNLFCNNITILNFCRADAALGQYYETVTYNYCSVNVSTSAD